MGRGDPRAGRVGSPGARGVCARKLPARSQVTVSGAEPGLRPERWSRRDDSEEVPALPALRREARVSVLPFLDLLTLDVSGGKQHGVTSLCLACPLLVLNSSTRGVLSVD